jgi:ectoine hydroxylase-related dioxygenase (phytanoyl-CoA dioxygenase family)
MLSQQQLDFFESKGYLVVEDVLDQATILNPIRKEYSKLLDGLIDDWVQEKKINMPADCTGFYDKLLCAYKSGCDWFQPMDISLPGDKIRYDTPMHFSLNTFNLLTSPSILDIVEQLIGPEITSNPIQHIRLKPPACALNSEENSAHISKTDWHQDRGVTLSDADKTNMITVWIAVSDATIDNGCLQVIPKSLSTTLLPHCGKRQTSIGDSFINVSEAISLPVKSGGLVIFHPLKPHSSLDNLTKKFRWPFDVRYNRTGESTGRNHFPEFIARSKSSPEKELKNWRHWKKMWEHTRIRLTSQEHISLHRWQADSPNCA